MHMDCARSVAGTTQPQTIKQDFKFRPGVSGARQNLYSTALSKLPPRTAAPSIAGVLRHINSGVDSVAYGLRIPLNTLLGINLGKH